MDYGPYVTTVTLMELRAPARPTLRLRLNRCLNLTGMPGSLVGDGVPEF